MHSLITTLLHTHLQLRVERLDGVLRFVAYFFKLLSKSLPETLRKDLPVIESVTHHILHLLLQDTIKVLHCVIDDLLLLRVELLVEFYLELGLPHLPPFFQIRHLLNKRAKVLESLRLQLLDFFQILILSKDLIGSF